MFVVDLVRCQNPNSFMSNMLFCVSIMFRLKLPMVVVFNKSDCVQNKEIVKGWLTDYDQLLVDLKESVERVQRFVYIFTFKVVVLVVG